MANQPDQFSAPGVDVVYRGDPNFAYGRSATASAQPFSNLVIHHTANDHDLDWYVNYGQTVDAERGGAFGYHFYIGPNGEIVQGAPLSSRTNHILPTAEGATARNSNSVGISIVGGDAGVTPAAQAAATRLGQALMTQYGIQPTNIYNHGDLQPNDRAEEGHNAGLMSIVNALRGAPAPVGPGGAPLMGYAGSPAPIAGAAAAAADLAAGGGGGLPTIRNGTGERGSPDANVRALQAFLNANGQNVEVDGIFGGMTERAVRAYQQANGLDVDGVVGPQTWGHIAGMAAATGTPAAMDGLPGPVRGFVQRVFGDTAAGEFAQRVESFRQGIRKGMSPVDAFTQARGQNITKEPTPGSPMANLPPKAGAPMPVVPPATVGAPLTRPQADGAVPPPRPRPEAPMQGPPSGPVQGPVMPGPVQGPIQLGQVQGPVRPGPVQGPVQLGPVQGPVKLGLVQGPPRPAAPPMQGPVMPPIQGPVRPPMQGPPSGPVQGPVRPPMQGPLNNPALMPRGAPSPAQAPQNAIDDGEYFRSEQILLKQPKANEAAMPRANMVPPDPGNMYAPAGPRADGRSIVPLGRPPGYVPPPPKSQFPRIDPATPMPGGDVPLDLPGTAAAGYIPSFREGPPPVLPPSANPKMNTAVASMGMAPATLRGTAAVGAPIPGSAEWSNTTTPWTGPLPPGFEADFPAQKAAAPVAKPPPPVVKPAPPPAAKEPTPVAAKPPPPKPVVPEPVRRKAA